MVRVSMCFFTVRVLSYTTSVAPQKKRSSTRWLPSKMTPVLREDQPPLLVKHPLHATSQGRVLWCLFVAQFRKEALPRANSNPVRRVEIYKEHGEARSWPGAARRKK